MNNTRNNKHNDSALNFLQKLNRRHSFIGTFFGLHAAYQQIDFVPSLSLGNLEVSTPMDVICKSCSISYLRVICQDLKYIFIFATSIDIDPISQEKGFTLRLAPNVGVKYSRDLLKKINVRFRIVNITLKSLK